MLFVSIILISNNCFETCVFHFYVFKFVIGLNAIKGVNVIHIIISKCHQYAGFTHKYWCSLNTYQMSI